MRRALAATALGLLALASPALAVTRDDVASEIRAYPWPVNEALRIAHCESKLNPSAVGGPNKAGTYDYGVFQLNSGGTYQSLGLTKAQALDYKLNIKAAYRLYRRRGWRPWTCR